ncbi:MAG TPA: hypothetical protein VJ798_00895 [Rhizomicrobium sp.]|nr:hypothetical protein [Rhizomicrobium sp.]
MISGAWCLYEKRSNRWIFCRRKRLLTAPVVTVICLAMVSLTAWLV